MSRFRKDINKILQGLKEGKTGSDKRLFEVTYNHLLVVARRYVYNKDDAEDVTQNAYLRIFKYINRFDGNQDGYNWMLRIIQNEAYRINKKNPMHLPLEDFAHNPHPKDLTDDIFAKDEVGKYMAGYSDLDRTLIYLKFYEDYSYSEIAEKLNMKKSTVHRRVSVIKKEIRENRKKELDENEKQ